MRMCVSGIPFATVAGFNRLSAQSGLKETQHPAEHVDFRPPLSLKERLE